MSVEAHQKMVKLVMGTLEEAIEAETLDCTNTASMAIEIVAKLKGYQLLLVDGEVHTFHTFWRNPDDIRYDNAICYQVYVPKGEAQATLCIWCNNPYGSKESGAAHQLCRNCYQYGPSEKTK